MQVLRGYDAGLLNDAWRCAYIIYIFQLVIMYRIDNFGLSELKRIFNVFDCRMTSSMDGEFTPISGDALM